VLSGGGSFFLDAKVLIEKVKNFCQEKQVNVLSMAVLHAQMLLNCGRANENQSLSF
jgi:hypothetical protein